MLVLVNRACAFLVVAGAAACSVQAACATELNYFPAPQATTSQQPNWAGFYIKNNYSAGADSVPWSTLSPTNGFSSSTTPAVNDTFGYNFQSGNFVFGLEGALAAANFDGRFTSPYLPLPSTGTWTPNMNWMSTVTGKVGYSFGQWMPYVKGGFAAADVSPQVQGPQIGAFSQGSEAAGWTAGVGLEYQFAPKWSLGLEYLYTDLGNGAGANGGPPITGAPEMYSTALKSQSLLGRLNFKPGW
jgi:outer membrane immunogenic protein